MTDIELTQVWLGIRPYVLIEADTDPADGELVLKVNAGGGPSALEIGLMPFLMLAQLPADQNPLSMGIGEYLADFPGDREVLARFAHAMDIPMPADEPEAVIDPGEGLLT